MKLCRYAMCLAFVMLVAFPSSVRATETETRSITSWCVLSTDADYAHAICERLKNEASKLAAKAKLGFSTDQTQQDKPGVPNAGNKVSAEGTLNLLFFIRGTKGGNVGVSVRIVAGVDVMAEDVGVTVSTPVRIVLWEQSAVAGGSVDKISKAMGDHMAGKLANFFDWLVAEIGKQE